MDLDIHRKERGQRRRERGGEERGEERRGGRGKKNILRQPLRRPNSPKIQHVISLIGMIPTMDLDIHGSINFAFLDGMGSQVESFPGSRHDGIEGLVFGFHGPTGVVAAVDESFAAVDAFDLGRVRTRRREEKGEGRREEGGVRKKEGEGAKWSRSPAPFMMALMGLSSAFTVRPASLRGE
jgi:hypothetical protein